MTFTVYGQPVEEGFCDRCGKPVEQVPSGLFEREYRHMTYAKRGKLCLHPGRRVSWEEALNAAVAVARRAEDERRALADMDAANGLDTWEF